jgi:hypothetical protein
MILGIEPFNVYANRAVTKFAFCVLGVFANASELYTRHFRILFASLLD